MGVVIPMLGSRPVAISPHQAFVLARRDMILAFSAWIKDQPDAEDVAEELDGTLSAMDQLRQLEMVHA